MKKMAIFGQFLAKNQEKLEKRAFFIFKSIIEPYKPDEPIHNSKKVSLGYLAIVRKQNMKGF